jgi:hypothetical protein
MTFTTVARAKIPKFIRIEFTGNRLVDLSTKLSLVGFRLIDPTAQNNVLVALLVTFITYNCAGPLPSNLIEISSLRTIVPPYAKESAKESTSESKKNMGSEQQPNLPKL